MTATPWLLEDDERLLRRVLDSDHPWLSGIDLERLRERSWVRLAVPEGFRPGVDIPLGTPDGTFRLGDLQFRPADGPDGAAERRSRYPLSLLTRKQQIAFLNTHYGAFPAHQPSHGELRVTLHPDDAAERGIVAGDRVEVVNDRGRLTCIADIGDATQPGLVTMPFGWWHRAAPEDRSVNVLTNSAVDGDDTGSAAFHDTQVDVRRLDRHQVPSSSR